MGVTSDPVESSHLERDIKVAPMATILIVDDRPTNRDVLVTLLKHKGHRLLEAADGVEALEWTRAERPHLIITDILMPTMDGYEFVRRLRADPALARTPIIFYTAYYLEREAQALAQAYSIQHILIKPSKAQVILQTVEAALAQSVPPFPPAPAEAFEREHIRLLTNKLSQTVAELQELNTELQRRARELEQEVAERQHAEQTAQRRAEQATRLYHLTAALSEALTPTQVADVVIRQGIPGLGARAGSVILRSEDRDTLQVIGSMGYPPEQIDRWSVFPVTAPIPLADAVRLGQPMLLSSPDVLQARYPHLTPDVTAGHLAWAAIPLLVEGRTIGAIGLSFAESRDFGPADQEFMLTLASQCAQALERARLYQAEARARQEAEAARLHLAVLAEAGQRLALSLDEATTLTQLQEMIVPAFADQCFIDLVIEAKTIRRVLYAGANPLQAHLRHTYELRYPIDPHHPDNPVLQVIRTGEAVLMPEITEALLPTFAYDAEQLDLIRQLGPESGMIVPLTAQGCTFGAISFLWAASGRRYDPADLLLAKDLANRAALALNNANLYCQALAEIAERKRTEKALHLSEERFAKAFRASPYALIISRLADGQIIEVNDSWQNISGYSRAEVIGESSLALNVFVNPADRQRAVTQLQQQGFVRDFELEIRRKSGEVGQVSLSIELIEINHELCMLTIMNDITERKQAEEALKAALAKAEEGQRMLEALMEYVPEGITIADAPDVKIRHVSRYGQELLGEPHQDLTAGQVVEQWMVYEADGVTPLPEADLPLVRAIRKGETVRDKEMIQVNAQGRPLSLLCNAAPVRDRSGQIVAGIVAWRDISERKRTEQQLAASLQEKEILLQEVNHRVKNNLNAVSQLIYLKAQTTSDPQVRQKFEDTQNRIKSIELIHEKLYQTKNFARINFAEYVDSLVVHLLKSYRVDPNLIRVKIESDPVELGIDTTTSLGVIVNELVTNALKYAFPNDQPGEIEISLKEQEEGWLCLMVSDNGIGFPVDKDLSSVTGSLGLQLVQMLAGHMQGTVEPVREHGTRFTVTFKPRLTAK